MPNPLRGIPYFWVPIGLLDDSQQQLEIAAHLFVGSKAPWEMIASQGEQYETAPALSEFISLLHSNGHA